MTGRSPGIRLYCEKNIGVNLDLKLADNWSAGAFSNVLLATGLPLQRAL